MAGTALQWDVSQLAPLARRIHQLGQMDRHALLEGIGAEIESQTRKRFETETDPTGKRWQADTAATILRKLGGSRRVYKKRGGVRKGVAESMHRLRILQDQGYLVDSIQFIVHGGRDVEIGSNLVYAAIHQFGGADAGMPQIPARPYLGLSAGDQADLLRIINGYLAEKLERA